MLSPDRAQQIFEKVLKGSVGTGTEAILNSTHYSLTRFANNSIHQNVSEESFGLSVRAVVDGRTARASTNQADEEVIRRTCESALALARLQPSDPNLLPMPGPATYRPLARVDEETRGLNPRARAERVREVIQRAERDRLTAAGIFSSGSSAYALLNSQGLSAFHEETVSEFSVTMLGQSSSGWAKKTSQGWAQLGTGELADRAARKAVASNDPRELAPGQYAVILEPAAVLDLLGFLVLDFSGLAVHEKRSCFTGRVGQKLFAEQVNIRDDVYHPFQSGAPFDGEGVPRQTVSLVEKGVVKNLVYSRQTAREIGAEPTGHGLPLPNEYGEVPLNIVMEGGSSTIDDMVHSTDRGLLVTRLWYIREVDPYRKILTGMTRDGTFWIEEGKVRHGVKNLRFNQSIIEMLAQIEMMGEAERTAGEETFEMVVPALKVRNFNFTSTTKF